jgi:hypothetical protein
MANITRELDELVANGIITPEVAENIRGYYKKENKPGGGVTLAVIAFGIIGALLVGMGIVLIIAHNWDTLSTSVKLFLGFLPLFAAQAIAGFIVFKQFKSQAWREATGVVLTFGVATAIAIVSQVYNLHGDFGNFLLLWSVLTLPIMYVLQSRISSLLFWMIITWHATEVGFGLFRDNSMPVYYWALAAVAVPFYINLIRKTPDANSVSFHNWVIGISLTIVLALGDYPYGEDLLIPAYVTLFSIFMLIGQLPYFANRRLINNAWLIGGSAGTIGMLLFLTFVWNDGVNQPKEYWLSVPMAIWVTLFIIASILLYIVGTKVGFRNVLSKSYTFIIFLLLFLIGLYQPLISRALTNILLLALGIYTIREGAAADKLWKMNYGLLILSVLIACRFFDTDMSFVLRGLLFVAIGVGFFAMNFYMIRKRKATV